LEFTFDADRSTRMRPRPRSMSRTRSAAISPHRSPTGARIRDDVFDKTERRAWSLRRVSSMCAHSGGSGSFGACQEVHP
jgi:hypothetical protein